MRDKVSAQPRNTVLTIPPSDPGDVERLAV